MKKDILLRFIQEQQQKLQPVVSNEGFKNGAPPPGTNYRIPSDTLYNPTPHRIKAVSNNGMQAELQPFDETQVHFPGAEYVDEYEMRMGGLKKFLPKAQTGKQTTIPADAERYGVNASYDANQQFVNQADVDAYNNVQSDINTGGARGAYEQRIMNEIGRQYDESPDGLFDITKTGFIPQYILDNPDSYYCISGVCYTISQTGEPIKFFSNSLAQDAVKNGEVPNWKLNRDTSNPQGGDILQFLSSGVDPDGKIKSGLPHHAGLVVPGSRTDNPDGTYDILLYMNAGDGKMYQQSYRINPKTDGVVAMDNQGNYLTSYDGSPAERYRYERGPNGLQTIAVNVDPLHDGAEFPWQIDNPIYDAEATDRVQFLTRDFSKEDADKVKKRNLKKQKIEDEDPQFFKKGQERRWATYAPGLITFTGDDHAYMYGEDLGKGNQYLGSLSEEANRLLTRNTDKFDYNLDELSKSAGFKEILGMVNDPQWKQDFMKKYNISNREFNGVVLNTLGIYGQETGFGTKKGGIKESDTTRRGAAMVQNVWNRLTGQGSNEVLNTEDYSRGLTQVKFRNISKEDREKYGLTAQNIESDPKKAFIAAMLVSTQNLPELRRLAQKGETAALDESNYLDFLPYMYQMPNRLRRGDKKTIMRAIDEGVSPDQALVKDPNSPEANNSYLKNVRTFASLFNHNPLQETLEIKKHGGPFSPLHKFLNY